MPKNVTTIDLRDVGGAKVGWAFFTGLFGLAGAYTGALGYFTYRPFTDIKHEFPLRRAMRANALGMSAYAQYVAYKKISWVAPNTLEFNYAFEDFPTEPIAKAASNSVLTVAGAAALGYLKAVPKPLIFYPAAMGFNGAIASYLIDQMSTFHPPPKPRP